MTRDEIAARLARLDLQGRNLIVHGDVDVFGTAAELPEAVCAALVEVVGTRGTVVMPAFTYAETLPPLGAGARYPSLPYHPQLEVSRQVGTLAEAFRQFPGVLRSNHPTHSFCAWGRGARDVLSTQRDNNLLGPIKKLNVVQGEVVLLGATLRQVTGLHLAAELAGLPYHTRRTAVRVNSAGFDERIILENVPGCSAGFDRLEGQLDPAYVTTVPLPNGEARRVSLRYLLQLAGNALRDDAAAFVCGDEECAACRTVREALAAMPASAGGG